MAYYIYSGIISSGIILNNDYMYISSGGVADSTTVNSGGSMSISSGGVANSTTVNSSGCMYIKSGGVANSTTVNSWGYMYISSRGTADNTTVNSGGYMYISSGGVANSTTVDYGGEMHISSGGIADSTTIFGGSMFISSGGIANSTTVYNFGNMHICGTANSTTVDNAGYMNISSGGTANNTTVNFGGNIYISSGGLANSTTVNDWGSMHISSAGTANDTTVCSGGYMNISSGGTAGNTTISGGNIHISSGGMANSTTVISRGGMTISSGGTADNTTVNSSGNMDISSGGTANSTTVNSGGYMCIYGGGTATAIKENGGYVRVYDGANVTFASHTISDLMLSYEQMTVHQNTVANSTTINPYGSIYIFSGGVAHDTTVNSGGGMTVYSGGTASIVYNPWQGSIDSSAGAVVEYLERDANIYLGGNDDGLISKTDSCSDILISSGNSMLIYSGGTANNNTMANGEMVIYFGGTANSTAINDWGGMYISSGGTANSTAINDWGGMYISSGGTANNITLSGFSATVTISSGGTATNIIWTPCVGHVSAADGAYVTYASDYSGVYFGSDNQLLSNTAVMNGKVLSRYCSMYVMSAGVANNTTVNSGGDMYISSGGTANDTTVSSGGDIHISCGGVANSTTVDGYMNIYSGGAASAADIQDGYMCIFSGGTANSTTMCGRASINISSGGTVNNTTIFEGYMNISSGGVANNTIVSGTYYGTGHIYISSGGTANDTIVSSGGEMHISSGGTANNTTVSSGGDIHISDGGVANSTTVDFYGKMHISSGSTANDTIVSSCGEMHISSGGVHRGSLLINSGAVVSAYEGSKIDFTIDGRTESDVYLINDLSLISGTPAYTITVSATQTWGIYKLAQGAANFDETISIGDGTTNYGSITVNGAMLSNNGVDYLLTQESGNLTLKIGDMTPPVAPTAAASTTAPTNRDVTVTATFSSDSTVKQYKIGNGNWINYTGAFAVSDNTTVSLRAEDAAGNESTGSLVIANIDKVAPTMELSADKTTPTNQDVVLTATVSDGTVEYYDGSAWVAGSSLTVSENGTYQFRVTDAAGNMVEQSIEVSNIDKVAPPAPTATASTSAPTNRDVTVTATFSSDSTIKQYKIGNGNWINYTGAFTVSDNTTVSLRAEDAAGNESTGSLVISNIDKVAPAVPTGFNEIISGYNATLDWSDVRDTGIAGTNGYYVRFNTTENLTGDGEFVTVSRFNLTALPVGNYYYQIKSEDRAGNVSDWSAIQSFEIIPGAVQRLQGNQNALNWDAISGVQKYIAEYSNNNFANVLQLETATSAVDTYQMPNGTWKVRVKAESAATSAQTGFTATAPTGSATQIVSDADGDLDVFFARTAGTWDAKHLAKHLGDFNGWQGTKERVALTGKNIITDVFAGSTDANILVLTDDANGDALFLDDMYSALGNQARLSNIDEIRAGAGNDVIDLTSPKFAYLGDEMTVFGGSGDDTIWANSGVNTLYGDAGNDRIIGGSGNDFIIGGAGNDALHGGGGNDTFCFGANWGTDTVEQLAAGKVILRFETGSMSNWNAASGIYSDGTNTVTVTGTGDIELYFGTASTLPQDAFAPSASEKIFEQLA